MGKVFIILLLCFQLFSIIEACPRCKTVEAKSVCLGSEVAVKFEATWNESQGDCPPNGGAQYQLMKDNVLMPETVADFFNPIHIASHLVDVAGKWKVRVRLNGTCSNGFTGYGPWSDYATFDVVELVLEGYTFCNAKGSESTTKDFATCLNKNGTIKPSIKIIPSDYKYKAEKVVAGNDEESNATITTLSGGSLPAGTITMGDKPGTIEAKFIVDADFVSCSSDANTSKCCDTAKGVFFIPDILRIKNECDQLYVDVDNKEAAKLEMAVILKGNFKDNGFIPTNSKAGEKAKITFTKTTKPIGYEDQLKIEGLDADEYEFTKSEAKIFILKCICAGSVQVSAKVHAYQIEITSPGDKLVKDNPIHSKGFEVEAPDNEPASRGDANGNEFIDEDQANFKVEVIKGPDTAYDLHIEIIDGNQFADLVLEAGNSTDDVDVSGESVVKLKLRGEKFSEDSKDVHVEVTLKHHSEVPTSKCSVGVAKTVVETDTWEPPIVYNPRPFVAISNITFVDGALVVTGTVQDWTCTSVGDFLRKNVNLTEASQTALTTGLDISKTQPLSATWSATVPIREGSGNTFVVTAAFQNRLKNFGLATATVNLTQNPQGKITAASIGVENNSKPSSFETIETFTVVSYDADGDTKPSVPWKLRASSGHEKEVETDQSKNTDTSHPTFVSKSYAVMLDNFFENKSPEYVLRAKPGDRLINLLECGTLNASEYTYSKGLYLGGGQPIESVNLNPGANNSISATLGGDFGEETIVDFISENASLVEIGFDFLWFIRQSDNELAITYRKYNIEEDAFLYLWDGKNHDDIKAEGGGELKVELDDLKSVEPTLHIEILTPKLKLKKDPASGPSFISWSEIRDQFYDGPFKSNIDKLKDPLIDLVGVAVTDVLPVIELDDKLKPDDIKITEKMVNGKKRYLGSFIVKGVVRDVLANINLEAKINFVSAADWDNNKNEMVREKIDLLINDEKISPAKPVAHTGIFNKNLKYELKHGKNYIRVVTGRNALGASNDAFYLIEATEVDVTLASSKLIIDKVTVLNPDNIIQWSPYFANIRNGLLMEGVIPEKITVGNANMKADHLYDKIEDGPNFLTNKYNNWSSKVFTLLPFAAKKPNTDYDLPLNAEINPDFGLINGADSSPFSASANDLASNKAEVFSVDLAIKDMKPEDEADKGFYIRKSENVPEPKSDCQPVYPVMIDLKTSAVVKKLVDSKKGELKLEVIKSKRTPDVSLSIKLADGQKIIDGSIIITDANQQIEVLGLENGVAELKLSYTYNGFYTQDIIRVVVCGLDFVEPFNNVAKLPIKIFQPHAAFEKIGWEFSSNNQSIIISGVIKDWSGDIDLDNLFCNGEIVGNANRKIESKLDIHGTVPDYKSIPSEVKFKCSLSTLNILGRNFSVSLVYKNSVGYFSDYKIQFNLNKSKTNAVLSVLESNRDFYPKFLEDIAPYLFRLYLNEPLNESPLETYVSYDLGFISGGREATLFNEPIGSGKYFSKRKVLIADGSRGNFDINNLNENILVGWPGSKPTMNLKIKTGQNLEANTVAIGMMYVDVSKSNPLTYIKSATNLDVVKPYRDMNYNVAAGIFRSPCDAPEVELITIESLDDQLKAFKPPSLEYFKTEISTFLKRVGGDKKSKDYYFYELNEKDGVLSVHNKTNIDLANINEIFTHGGYQKINIGDEEYITKVIQPDILSVDNKSSESETLHSVNEFVSLSDNKPIISLKKFNIKKVIQEEIDFTIADFVLIGSVYDEYSNIVENSNGDINFLLINDQTIPIIPDRVNVEPTISKPYEFKGEFNGVAQLKISEGENKFILRSSKNILGHDDIVFLSVNAKKQDSKIKILDTEVKSITINLPTFNYHVGFHGGTRIENNGVSVNINDEIFNLSAEFREVLPKIFPSKHIDAFTGPINSYVAHLPKISQKKVGEIGNVLNSPAIIFSDFSELEINKFLPGEPFNAFSQMKVDIEVFDEDSNKIDPSNEISPGLFLPILIGGNALNKSKFQIKVNSEDLFEKYKNVKISLSLLGEKSLNVYRKGIKVLGVNKKEFSGENEMINTDFQLYGLDTGINYIVCHLLIEEKVVAYDIIRITSSEPIDLDVDSDNNNFFALPDRNEDEQNLEDKLGQPGKFVNVNSEDEDLDGIPDFADGMNIDGLSNSEDSKKDDLSSKDKFIPLVLQLPNYLSLSDFKLNIKYKHSGAIKINRIGSGSDLDPFNYLKEKNSSLRIWKKPANISRNFKSVKEDKQSGDFIAPGEYQDLSLIGFSDSNRKVILFIEGIAELSSEGETIEVILESISTGKISSDLVKILVFDLNIGVDGDRDGKINFTEIKDKKIVFWVNDDHDEGYEESPVEYFKYVEDDLDLKSEKDCDDNRIGTHTIEKGKFNIEEGCLRDLEDFAPLNIGSIHKHLLFNSDIQFQLNFENVRFSKPGIKIFRSVADHIMDYLQLKDIGDNQIKELALFPIFPNSNKEINKTELSENNISKFIFEGMSKGQGNLTLNVILKGRVICQRKIYCDLRSIDTFYREFVVNNDPEFTGFTESRLRKYTYEAENDKVFLFVHGWRMGGDFEKQRWIETIFKRLWWQGYRGHVYSFNWHDLGVFEYDNSDENAWNSADALDLVIQQLNSGKSKGQVRIMAHSQGNVVVGEYLRSYAKENDVHSYIATQAAISANFYANNLNPYWDGYETPDIFGFYPFGNKGNPYMYDNCKKTLIFRYFNTLDWALDLYTTNNKFRPKDPYRYVEGDKNLNTYIVGKDNFFRLIRENGTTVWQELGLDNFQSRYAIFSQCVESRAVALGAIESIGNNFKEHVNLINLVNYDDHHYSHSRPFRSNTIDEFSYWEKVVEDLKLK